jgi:hypothetical protein
MQGTIPARSPCVARLPDDAAAVAFVLGQPKILLYWTSEWGGSHELGTTGEQPVRKQIRQERCPSMSLIRLLPARLHAVADYLVAALLILVPLIVHGPMLAVATGVVVGIVVAVLSALTRYPLGVVKVLPFTVHSAGDYLAAVLLIAAPFALHFNHTDPRLSAFYAAAGVAVLAVSLVTNYQYSPKRASTPAQQPAPSSQPTAEFEQVPAQQATPAYLAAPAQQAGQARRPAPVQAAPAFKAAAADQAAAIQPGPVFQGSLANELATAYQAAAQQAAAQEAWAEKAAAQQAWAQKAAAQQTSAEQAATQQVA